MYRKHREAKPFALMSCNIAEVRKYAEVDPEGEKILTSYQRPILILRKKEPNSISEAVAPNNNYVGVMLPYTPLHYLIFNPISHFGHDQRKHQRRTN